MTMTLHSLAALIATIAARCTEPCTFEMLAEEVELHLAERGKHPDTPAMEWLEIATIALNALLQQPEGAVVDAVADWQKRHG